MRHGEVSSHRLVHGDDLPYRFFLDLFADDSELAARLPARMLASMGICLPLDVNRAGQSCCRGLFGTRPVEEAARGESQISGSTERRRVSP